MNICKTTNQLNVYCEYLSNNKTFKESIGLIELKSEVSALDFIAVVLKSLSLTILFGWFLIPFKVLDNIKFKCNK